MRNRGGGSIKLGVGAIVRLIDVVLILLFGFILIADIETLTSVNLLKPRKDTNQPPPAVLLLGINPRGEVFEYTRRRQALDPLPWPAVPEHVRSRAEAIRAAAGAESCIVKVIPDVASRWQRTVDLFDVCAAVGLRSSL